MNKIPLYLFFLLLSSYCSLSSQSGGWKPVPFPKMERMVSKQEGNIQYIVDSAFNLNERKEAIQKTREYIADNLTMINEQDLQNPSLYY